MVEHGIRDRSVVAAALVDDLSRPTRLLAARRTAPLALAGRWELPGGKVERRESLEQALRRELLEELGVTLRLGEQLTPPDPTGWPLPHGWRMQVWWAVAENSPRPLQDHDELRWLRREEFHAVPWLESNRAVLAAVAGALLDG